MDYLSLRKKMVEEQLIRRGISDKKVIAAFLKVERHKFIPLQLEDSAYDDYPLPIGENQTISQPYIVALMTECLCLTGKEVVLEIGTGSGYQAAILAELSKTVYTIERIVPLAQRAAGLFKSLGYSNIYLKIDDGALGWQEYSPFDRIVVTAACPQIPPPITAQLKTGGRLVLPVGDSVGQELLSVRKTGNGGIEADKICGCVFVPLLGEYGFKGN
ncbi:MAG: protein-L-isoaspartate(D-aspartate) O-methyltransferase [Candidatus Omnitrophota bacterium]